MVLNFTTQPFNNEQDDASVSSTLTVERYDSKQQLHSSVSHAGGHRQPKKSVTFDMMKNVEYELNSVPSNDFNSSWYSPRDYKEFKAQAKDAANQIVHIEAKNRAPFSYQRVMENTFNSCLQAKNDSDEILAASDFVHLLRWIEVASSRCGLEKWSLGSISRDRSTRRKEITATVLSIQKNDCGSESDEFIRLSCENISRPSRLYAHIMAQALADAEMKGNRPQ